MGTIKQGLCFKRSAHTNLSNELIGWRKRGGGYTDKYGRRSIFELWTINKNGGWGVIQGLTHDWLFHWVTPHDAIEGFHPNISTLRSFYGI